jgi:hypothetical protein
MSFNQFFNDKSALACNEVLNSFVLLIEGSIEQPHEQAMRQLMQDTLRRSCNEKAPEDLHDAIYRQIHGQMAGSFTEVVTQYSMTEISIEIDEFGQIEHREVTIEHTEEIRFINDDNDPRGLNGQG